MESRMRPKTPVRFGERNGEDRREQSLYGVSVPTPRGFDSKANRKAIFNAGLIPNIPENPRNRKRTKRGRKRLFDAVIHT